MSSPTPTATAPTTIHPRLNFPDPRRERLNGGQPIDQTPVPDVVEDTDQQMLRMDRPYYAGAVTGYVVNARLIILVLYPHLIGTGI